MISNEVSKRLAHAYPRRFENLDLDSSGRLKINMIS